MGFCSACLLISFSFCAANWDLPKILDDLDAVVELCLPRTHLVRCCINEFHPGQVFDQIPF